MKISIVGATGYTGEELLRILAGHPAADIVYITSESQTGAQIENIYPHFTRFYNKKLVSINDLETIGKESDVAFIALPHGHAMKVGKTLSAAGVRIIDLGADYRFTDTAVYEQWYKVKHTHPGAGAVYGLTELFRDQIKKAAIVGNPGCFTTASILALAPLVKQRLLQLDSIIIDAKSGVSGAGRGASLNTHFTELFDSLKAYNIAGHRHTPEIEQAFSLFAGREVRVTFTPHLVPVDRGILSTCYAGLAPGVEAGDIDKAYEELYGGEYFIRLLGRGGYPATKYTRGANFCDIGWHIDHRTNRVIAVAALDNLVKGAAGQAVQNLNVMFGLDERLGLEKVPLYP